MSPARGEVGRDDDSERGPPAPEELEVSTPAWLSPGI
jgi:hypothetical protein